MEGYWEVNDKGFSLIEVIVVLLIIGLTIALVTPSLSRFSSTVELKASAKKISAILRYYRSEAINQGKVYQIFFDSDLNEVRVQPAASTEEKGESEKKGENDAQKTYALPKGVHIKEVKVELTQYPSDLPTIEFYSNGGSNGGTITLDSQDRQGYKIEVNFLTGIVALQRTSI
ncbi:MAG: GspH/FimT family pseudopilin [Thermodesulfobacteriota bacterium]